MAWPPGSHTLGKAKTTSGTRENIDPIEKQEPFHRNSKLLFRTQSQNPKVLKSGLAERNQAGSSEFSAPCKLFLKNDPKWKQSHERM